MTRIATLAFALTVSACSFTGPDEETLTLYVAAYTAECVGAGPMDCLLVREEPDAPWYLFHDGIEGFTHEPGWEYVLRVARRRVANPPQDGSSVAYRLIYIVERRAAP